MLIQAFFARRAILPEPELHEEKAKDDKEQKEHLVHGRSFPHATQH